MYRFGQVARAIGMGEPALRNWLRRNKIDLFEAQPEGGWHVFTENDIFVLAVAAEMVRYGAPVKSAVEQTTNALGCMNFKTWDRMPDLIWAAQDQAGNWLAETDRGLLYELTKSATLIEITVPMIFKATQLRLAWEDDGESGELVG